MNEPRQNIMDLRQKTNLISLIVMLICVALGIITYMYTGNILVVILFAPPIIHWILKKERDS